MRRERRASEAPQQKGADGSRGVLRGPDPVKVVSWTASSPKVRRGRWPWLGLRACEDT
jgi:hypothetical protein